MKRMPKFVPCKRCGGTGKEINQSAIGGELRQLRESKKYSLREVAVLMGVSASYVSDLERGKRAWSEDRINQYKKIIQP